MHTGTARERFLQKSSRARLRDQVVAWNKFSGSAALVTSPGPAPQTLAEIGGIQAAPGVSSQELTRKLWHITPGALILGLPLVRGFEPFATHLPIVIVVVTAGLVFFSWYFAAAMTRPGERDWNTSVWAFAATALLPLIAFPAHCELALTAIVLLSLGDGAAALGGQTLRRIPLPWNHRKTLAGSLAFVLCAAPAAAWVYWANAEPRTTFAMAALGALAAAALASAVESLPSTINDNIRVGAAAVISTMMMHWWLAQ